ncbi:nucleoside-diphosphate kinase [Mitsuokella sp. AF21-1AC]|uniref:nucleoside-diphosphate kinase n=1 Tax=Mitsuokella sp. AF21-1AC TaxID=2292235 RepID=UPI000E47B42D|nr:nucleoside-diphosphate kinase [Mitsuokella sp. AF21-1AC]RGS74512.1 nucleoside-diphosphate kinase [Mitsuokella sp. AF21-1AC]
MEKTLVLIKPDAFDKHYSGDIIKRYEQEGFRIVAMKLLKMDERLASIHYAEHIGRPYYKDLVGFMTSGPLIAMVLEGENAIARVREINGKTNPAEAAEGTIRKQFAASGRRNAVHASDSPASAKREISIFFSECEIYDGTYEIMD